MFVPEGDPVAEQDGGPNVRLPIEIHEKIISFLHEEGWAIAKCALVCRTWLPFSRSLLYDEVHLVCRYQYCRFLRLLVDPPSDIVPYLQHVRVLSIMKRAAIPDFCRCTLCSDYDYSKENALNLQDFVKGVRHLSGLVEMIFDEADWRQEWLFSAFLYREWVPLQTTVTTLDVSGCYFTSVYQLQALVCAFPALTKLVIDRTMDGDSTLLEWHLSPPINLELVSKGPRLKCLYLDHTHPNMLRDIIQWLIASRSVQSLSTLVWGNRRTSPEVGNTIPQLLEAIGGSLEHLVCQAPLLEPLRDLSLHGNLISLRITGDPQPVQDLGVLKQLLASVTTTQLEKVSIAFYSHDDLSFGRASRDFDSLKDIDDMLSCPRFRNLQRVEVNFIFVIHSDDKWAALRSIMREIPSDVGDGQPAAPVYDSSDPYSMSDNDKDLEYEYAINCHEYEEKLCDRARPLVWQEIEKRFKNLSSRGIFHPGHIVFRIFPMRMPEIAASDEERVDESTVMHQSDEDAVDH